MKTYEAVCVLTRVLKAECPEVKKGYESRKKRGWKYIIWALRIFFTFFLLHLLLPLLQCFFFFLTSLPFFSIRSILFLRSLVTPAIIHNSRRSFGVCVTKADRYGLDGASGVAKYEINSLARDDQTHFRSHQCQDVDISLQSYTVTLYSNYERRVCKLEFAHCFLVNYFTYAKLHFFSEYFLIWPIFC